MYWFFSINGDFQSTIQLRFAGFVKLSYDIFLFAMISRQFTDEFSIISHFELIFLLLFFNNFLNYTARRVIFNQHIQARFSSQRLARNAFEIFLC